MSNVGVKPATARAGPGTSLREESDSTVIAARHLRHERAIAFRIFVWGASAVFVALAIVAHSVAYFPIDVTVTHAVQAYPEQWGAWGQRFGVLMHAISWIGYFPQVAVLSAIVVITLFATGLRWEAAAALFATLGGGLGALVKLAVLRPRPSADVVHVLQQLPSSGFPSGHVLSTTAFCGFMAFLGYALLESSRARTALLVALALVIALMGPSRIYLGQHWFSDVMGAYLLGSLWLALTIRFYGWGKARWSGHHPVAPATLTTSDVGTALGARRR